MNWQLTLINHSQKHPLWVVWAVFVLIIFSILGLLKLNLDVNFQDYFAHDDAGFIGLNQIETRFQQRNELLLLLENKQDWRAKEQQSQLSNFIQQLSLNEHIANIGGYASFISSPSPDSSTNNTGVLSYKQHPRLPLVISETGNAILLNVSFNDSGKEHFPNETLWREQNIDTLLETAKTFWSAKQRDEVHVYLSGEQALNWQYAKVLRHDLAWFAPSLLLIITLMAVLFIRTRIWLLAIGINCLVTLVLTLGVAGWFNLTIAAISAFIPVIIITLSLAYSSHLYLAWKAGIQNKHHEPLTFSFVHNKLPLFYATITTMVGFGLLGFSPSPPIQAFGLLVSVAVMCHYLLCHSLLVVIINQAVVKTPQQSKLTLFSVEPIARKATYYPKTVLVIVAVISMLALTSSAKLELNDDPFSYFPKDNPFSQSKQKMQHYFDGVNLINYEISTAPYDIYDKHYLAFLYQFARFLKQQPEVERVTHIGDWVKSSGLSQSQFKRAVSQNAVDSLGLDAEISDNYQSSLVSIYLNPLTARQLISFEERVSVWLGENQADLSVSPALGNSLLFAHLSIDNAKNMLWSFAIALLMLSIIVGLLKRSVIFALIAMMVNVLPLLWVFGTWQVLGGYISIGSAVVLGMMLGIIVDDTLHLLLKLPEPKNAEFLDNFWLKYTAIIPVISFTSLTLLLGFGVGLASDFAPITQLSMLSCLVIVLAWLFDVMVLPVIYHLWRHYQDEC